MRIRLVGLVTISCLVLLASACSPERDDTGPAEGPVAEGPAGSREIIQIAGDLYEARDGGHNTVFLVTPEGVILGDPMGVEAAQWLKQEIAERFDATVEYVIYSHHHPEHSTGGNVFADTATFVAHENTVAALNAPFPAMRVRWIETGTAGSKELTRRIPGTEEGPSIVMTETETAVSPAKRLPPIHPCRMSSTRLR